MSPVASWMLLDHRQPKHHGGGGAGHTLRRQEQDACDEDAGISARAEAHSPSGALFIRSVLSTGPLLGWDLYLGESQFFLQE